MREVLIEEISQFLTAQFGILEEAGCAGQRGRPCARWMCMRVSNHSRRWYMNHLPQRSSPSRRLWVGGARMHVRLRIVKDGRCRPSKWVDFAAQSACRGAGCMWRVVALAASLGICSSVQRWCFGWLCFLRFWESWVREVLIEEILQFLSSRAAEFGMLGEAGCGGQRGCPCRRWTCLRVPANRRRGCMNHKPQRLSYPLYF